MDPLNEREIIRRLLRPYADVRYAYGDIHNETVFDDEAGRYLVMSHGWMDGRRVYGCLIHAEIVGDKIWVQRDGTEDAIADELVAAGIPRSSIVLGFWDPEAQARGVRRRVAAIPNPAGGRLSCPGLTREPLLGDRPPPRARVSGRPRCRRRVGAVGLAARRP